MPSPDAPALGVVAETTAGTFAVRTLAALAGLFCLAGALLLDPVHAESDGADRTGLAPDFGTLDADADGTLTRREWMESSSAERMSDDVAAAHYAMYDIDGNGGVSAAEYEQVNAEVLGGMGAKSI